MPRQIFENNCNNPKFLNLKFFGGTMLESTNFYKKKPVFLFRFHSEILLEANYFKSYFPGIVFLGLVRLKLHSTFFNKNAQIHL